MGGGVVLDLGVYAIQVSQWAFEEAPQKVIAKGELNEDGVDKYVEAELHYSGGRVGKLTFGAKEELANRVIFKGTKGEITVHCCLFFLQFLQLLTFTTDLQLLVPHKTC